MTQTPWHGTETASGRAAPDGRTGVREFLTLFLRWALAAAFLSAVADRFGFWGGPDAPGVAWGDMEAFLAYTAELNPWAPRALVPVLGWTATILEVGLAVLLILGLQIRRAAAGSGLLLLAFALAMSLTGGLKSALDASVFTAAAGALLLSTQPPDRFALDRSRSRR